MGVDISTYRGRIGTFSYQNGVGVITVTVTINFSLVFKSVGSVVFVGLLLIIAGIEQNPGPYERELSIPDEKSERRNILKKALPQLVEKLNPDRVLDFLSSDGVLSDITTRDIKEIPKTSDRTRQIISEICKKDADTSYTIFMKALKNSNHSDLVEYLDQLEDSMRTEQTSSPRGKISTPIEETPKAETHVDTMTSNFHEQPPLNSDTNEDEDEDEFYDTQDSPTSGKNPEIERILDTLGLTKKIETKIKISDVIQMDISVSKVQSSKDIPYIFLKKLLSGNSDAMDYRSFKTEFNVNIKVQGSVEAIYQPREAGSISPHDIFRCNPQEREPCREKWHKFKEYKTLTPGWDIEPVNNLDDRSQFWMWFIGQYAEELSTYHSVDVTNVLKAWTCISPEEALRSLRSFFGTSV